MTPLLLASKAISSEDVSRHESPGNHNSAGNDAVHADCHQQAHLHAGHMKIHVSGVEKYRDMRNDPGNHHHCARPEGQRMVEADVAVGVKTAGAQDGASWVCFPGVKVTREGGRKTSGLAFCCFPERMAG